MINGGKFTNLLKRVLPAPVLGILRRIRTRCQKLDPKIAQLRKRHLSYQPADPNEITLRPGITLRIDVQSRDPFECFCFSCPEMTCELDRFIENVGAYSSFVDVGANHGIFSLTFCALHSGGPVVAIDPSPIAFEILQRNVDLNSFSQLRARKVACGAGPGQIRMKRNWHHLEAVREDDRNVETFAIPMRSLDQICEEENVLPELLKIDVEGLELPVLQGAERVLHTANLLFLEIHPEATDKLHLSEPSVFDFLTSRGWKGYTLEEEAPLTPEHFARQKDIFRTMWRQR
jgi:FkbM family methyltransferase